MKFDPVHLDPPLDGALSATFLRAFNSCRRSAFLYQSLKGGASEPQLERGSALHAVCERALNATVEANESAIPPELVKAIADEVLADPQFHVPIEEHDYVRECAWRWGNWMTMNPAAVVAVERMIFLDVGAWRVRMKIDYAELTENGGAVLVRDWKSAKSMFSYEDLGRRRPLEGRVAPKSIQLILYALGIVHGVPVTVITLDPTGERVEIPEPQPLAPRAQRIDLEYVYPGVEDKATGGPAKRELSMTRLELGEYMESVRGLLERVSHAVDTGDWRAQQGDHCGECPAPSLCPIPAAVRKWAPNVDSPEEAAAEAEAIQVEDALLKARRERLRNVVKRLPGQRLRFGANMVIEPVPTTTTTIRDKDAFIEAAQRAAEFGEPFEPFRFVRTTTGAPIRPRKLSELEIEEEIMSNLEEQANG